MNAYQIFKKELNEAQSFYRSCLFAFSLPELIENNIDKIKTVVPEIEEFMAQKPSYQELTGNAGSKLEYFLRELIHIRIISALEVYLVDNIKYISLHSKQPFKSNAKVEITTQELLSYKSTSAIFEKIINKECRQLSGSGYKKICKFYKDKLNIDIANTAPGYSIMMEYHDRRHLLVHRLGRTDAFYKGKYNTIKKGVTIKASYLKSALTNVDQYVEKINELTINTIKEKDDSEKEPKNKTITVRFKSLGIYV